MDINEFRSELAAVRKLMKVPGTTKGEMETLMERIADALDTEKGPVGYDIRYHPTNPALLILEFGVGIKPEFQLKAPDQENA